MHRFTLASSLLLTAHAGAAGTLPLPADQPPYDSTFGGSGLVQEPVHGLPAGWGDVVTDRSGVLAVGAALKADGTLTGVMARFDNDGGRNVTFGRRGLAEIRFGFQEARACCAVLLPKDGKLLVAGHAYATTPARIGIGRFDARTGHPDTGFGHQGNRQVATEVDGHEIDVVSVSDLAADPADGRSYLCFHGLTPDGDAYSGLLCVKQDGSPESTFSGNGQILCRKRHGADAFQYVAVDSRRRVVTAGLFRTPELTTVMVCRFGPDGRPDPAFGFGGSLLVSDLPFSRPASVMVDSSNRILVAGDVQDPLTLQRDYFVVRLDGRGAMDATFGVGGLFTGRFVGLGSTASLVASAATLDAQGNIVIAGESDSRRDPGWVGLARIRPTGTVDTAYSSNGSARFPLFHARYWVGPKSVAIDPQGRIVVAGTLQDDELSNNTAFLLRSEER